MMTLDRYADLTARLEREAREDPRWYRFRVACLVGIAYCYIGLMAMLAFGLLAGAVWLLMHIRINFTVARLAIPVVLGLLVFCGGVLRALWVVIPEPRGREIKREEALPLFQEIDRLRGILNTPRFDKVMISAQFNAGVAQVPRLGLFGWNRNILMVGVPLMLVLSPDQFRAVLAHEMGHIAGDDSKFQHKVYRLNDTWRMLYDGLAEDNAAANILFVPFFEWYIPYFFAYTLALRRVDEYAADKAAARAMGAEKIADALINLALFPRRMMAQEKGEPTDPATQGVWLAEAMAETDDLRDEHPCLQNRLRGIGQLHRGVVPPTEELSAAEKFFDYRLPTLAESVGIRFVKHEPEAAPSRPAPATLGEIPDPFAEETPSLQPVGAGRF